MVKAIMWSSDKGDLPFTLALTNNLSATTDPGVTNDSSQGYSTGSQWINATGGRSWLCLSAAVGAAVWVVDGASGSAGFGTQGAPAAKNTATTLTAAELLGGLITSGPAAAINLQLPLATDLDTAVGAVPNNTSFDFSIANTSTTAANTDTITTNTGWTLVGNMVVPGLTAGPGTSGRFRARKTGAGAWTLYRIS